MTNSKELERLIQNVTLRHALQRRRGKMKDNKPLLPSFENCLSVGCHKIKMCYDLLTHNLLAKFDITCRLFVNLRQSQSMIRKPYIIELTERELRYTLFCFDLDGYSDTRKEYLISKFKSHLSDNVYVEKRQSRL